MGYIESLEERIKEGIADIAIFRKSNTVTVNVRKSNGIENVSGLGVNIGFEVEIEVRSKSGDRNFRFALKAMSMPACCGVANIYNYDIFEKLVRYKPVSSLLMDTVFNTLKEARYGYIMAGNNDPSRMTNLFLERYGFKKIHEDLRFRNPNSGNDITIISKSLME